MAFAIAAYAGVSPEGFKFAGTWGACGGIVGYAAFSFMFSKSSDRVGAKRALLSRVVAIAIVVTAMMGYVAAMGALA